MSWRNFAGSLLFAAFAGTLSYPLALVLTPVFGWWGSPGVVFSFWVVLYTVGLVRGAAPRALATLALSALAVCLHIADASFASLAVSLGAALALTRSAFVFRARPLRSVVVEAALGFAALGMLVLFGGGGPGATAFGVWGYFLVQSGYPLFGGSRERVPEFARRDPFDEARRQAERILEGV